MILTGFKNYKTTNNNKAWEMVQPFTLYFPTKILAFTAGLLAKVCKKELWKYAVIVFNNFCWNNLFLSSFWGI